MARVKILLVTDDASVGGGQKHVLALARRLDPRKFEVAVACPQSGFLVNELERFGIRHYPVTMPERPTWRTIVRLRNIIRSFGANVVHSHGGTAGFYGRLSSLYLPSIRRIHTYHGIHYLNFKGGWKKQLYTAIDRSLLGVTERVICVAHSDFQLGLRAGVVSTRRGIVIVNGIDVREFRPRRRSAGRRTSRKIVVGTVGRLHIQKGHEDLLKAAKKVLEENPRVSFCIIGEGELRGHLESVTEKLGIRGRVSFLGGRTDIARQLSKMDVFVLPSLWEGFPIVVLEAMAARKPIVASAVNGVLEILEHGKTALLVPPGDPSELSKAIIRMVTDTRLAKSCASRALATVSALFAEENMVRQTEGVYLTNRI